MQVLVVVVAVAAVVLATSGVLKVLDPGPSVELLVALGWPAHRGAVQAVGAAEVVVGLLVLSLGGPGPALALAALYAAFAALTALAIRRAPPGVSCGCFGALSAEPTWGHVAIDVGAAVAGVVGGIAAVGALGEAAGDGPLPGLLVIALVLLGSVAVLAATTDRAGTSEPAGRTGADRRDPGATSDDGRR